MNCPICGCLKVRWLSVATVAAQFQASPHKVRRMLLEGELDGVKFRGEWRIDHEALDEYVQKDSVRWVDGEKEPPPSGTKFEGGEETQSS